MNKNSTKIINLEGAYNRDGFTLTSDENIKILISKRKEVTKKKTELYLLLNVDGKYQYVSSLYPRTTDHEFTFDYKGLNYNLAMYGSSANISRA